MKSLLGVLLACLFLVSPLSAVAAEQFLVRDGQPQAEIIIVENAPRTTLLAAQELQKYIAKISGAKLPIGTDIDPKLPVKVYIGSSPHTEKLKLSTKELQNGAYRMVSGDDWLALIGDDTNFTPIEPWPRSNADWVSGRVHEEWDKITGAKWGNSLSQLRKHYTGSAGSFGKPDAPITDKEGNVYVWGFDERGSFNAVCGYLRSLGVRWYMPGEIGEVLPKLTSIPLPKVDQTVQPHFPVRKFNFRFGVHNEDIRKWAMHLGIREPYGLQTAHGLHTMTHREEILEAHPDWFALYGGKRHNQPGQRLNQLCYSNEELLQETVRFVRAQMDHYKVDVVSVMPPDGYTAICQCPLCEGKDTPERDYRGRLSDYVWDFVNRVAREVKKTHPDKMISNCAYGVYTWPPENIEKLESNIQVIIVGGRRPTASQPEQQADLAKLRADWAAKTDNPIMIFENYPFTDRGWYLPSYVPHVIGESINATKDISQGEDIWLSIRQDFDKVAIGYNHFPVYFTARMYWGGKDQDVDPIFQEYCEKFYGPAGEEMKAFFLYCEQNWQAMEKEKSHVDQAMKLFHVAQQKVEEGSVYAQRLALIGDYLQSLQDKGVQLAQKRGPVPQLRLMRGAAGIEIDGKLDDPFWEKTLVHAQGNLRELQTGRQPIYGTSFKAAWGNDGNLYLAIRCEEQPGEPLNIGTKRDGDQATWYGDVVEILLATEAHSYYQIAVNPAGAIVDLDRGAAKSNWFNWASQAEVATQVYDDHWTVEIRIPVIEDENDPLHQVIGRKPTSSLPWHFNVCRQRIRENGSEHSAFSPTGTSNFHVPMKFAHLYEGRSHQFDKAPTSDFLAQQQAATHLLRGRKYAEALAAFVSLSEGKITPEQTSAALQQAAACARALEKYEQADELAGQIPIEAVSKTVQMQNLIAQRKLKQLIEKFESEEIGSWPFWQRGEAFFMRGQAYSRLGKGPEAEKDLVQSLEFTTASQARLGVLLELGENRQSNLKDDEAALEAFQQIVAASRNNGSATYFRGLQGAARILTRGGKTDEALEILKRVDASKMRGYWHGALLLSLGETLQAADRKEEALAAYEEILTDDSTMQQQRAAAKEAIEKLK